MISPELRIEGFDAESWTHLLKLFLPDAEARVRHRRGGTKRTLAGMDPAGTLVVVDDARGQVLSAFHSLRGPVPELFGTPLELDATGDEGLRRLAERWSARRALVLREGALEELAERLALRVRRGEGYLSQILQALRVVRELEQAGLLRLWPNPAANVPVPSPGTVRRALDLVLPDEHAAVLVLWEDAKVWTACAIRRRGGDVDLVAGPDLILRWAGPLGGDWRRDYRVIVDSVARSVAPVHFGLFADADVLATLLREAQAGDWSYRVGLRDVILHPLPRAAGVALGADALRAAGRWGAAQLGGLDVVETLTPMAQRLRARLSTVRTVSETLGFDPMAVLADLLQRAEEPGEPPREG
ncbi:MAG: hypothetical protein AAGH15_24355 [Myxococcota bacterium]